MITVLFTEPQNDWVWEATLEVIWSNSRLKQGHIGPITHDPLQIPFEYLQQRRLHHLSRLPMPLLSQWGSVAWCSEWTFCVSSFCLWSHHWVPLKWAWLCLCCTLPSGVYIHGWDPSEPSPVQDEQSQPSWLFLVEELLLLSLWPFVGLPPVCSCISCTGESRTGPTTPDVTSQGLNWGTGSDP